MSPIASGAPGKTRCELADGTIPDSFRLFEAESRRLAPSFSSSNGIGKASDFFFDITATAIDWLISAIVATLEMESAFWELFEDAPASDDSSCWSMRSESAEPEPCLSRSLSFRPLRRIEQQRPPPLFMELLPLTRAPGGDEDIDCDEDAFNSSWKAAEKGAKTGASGSCSLILFAESELDVLTGISFFT